MKLIFDTHVLIWWFLAPDKLPSKFEAHISKVEKRNEQIGVSIISFWESGLLANLNRLHLTTSIHQWFEKLSREPLLEVLPLSGAVILESLSLGNKFPKDPADRFIAATARVYGLKLLTSDEAIRKSGQVVTL
ncbi:MAG: type II toxin-antitoxin system VapC family toxin [Deltaproteobacteria bacterium]|nr:type II toxin-antitoxin system VapC family toxin [Deltaproteobacteria bacterium]MBI3293939.1 type II toxin-antitoxin system VapC family toxin [Deltaproteobacteria bacterium]